MKRKLKEELIKLSTDIITSRDDLEITELYHAAQQLYEKLAVLKFIEEKLQHLEVDVSKSELGTKFEKIATAVINENRTVPETNPHEEDIMIPGMDTIKHMVSEMPGGEELEEVLERFLSNNDFIKSDKDIVTPDIPDTNGSNEQKSLNDSLSAKEISVGLNDRLAFVKHLFNESTEDFNRILSQLNTIESQERSISFIEQMVKPEYNHWKGKEEYESRFMALIERRFS